MNIKSDEAYALACEIAAETGATLTQVVLDALRARKRELGKEERIARIRALAKDTAARLSDEAKAIDHGAYLYDDLGLPK